MLISVRKLCSESYLTQVSQADVQSSVTHLYHSASKDGGGKIFSFDSETEEFSSLSHYLLSCFLALSLKPQLLELC